MKCTRWLVALAMVLSVAAMAADNPYKTAKVGEWIEYAMTTQVMGQNMQMKTKQTVTARDATSVTIKIESWMGGQKMPASEQKILFEKPFEPYNLDAKMTDAVVTPMGTGSETLTVGGKPYACQWAKVHIVATKPMPMDSITKVWSSKAVPMSGMVKMETDTTMKMGEKSMVTKMTMELAGFGNRACPGSKLPRGRPARPLLLSGAWNVGGRMLFSIKPGSFGDVFT